MVAGKFGEVEVLVKRFGIVIDVIENDRVNRRAEHVHYRQRQRERCLPESPRMGTTDFRNKNCSANADQSGVVAEPWQPIRRLASVEGSPLVALLLYAMSRKANLS